MMLLDVTKKADELTKKEENPSFVGPEPSCRLQNKPHKEGHKVLGAKIRTSQREKILGQINS